MVKDEYVIVLDFLAHGKSSDIKGEPVAQTIGEKFFNLLEIVIREDTEAKPGDRIYVGMDKRDKVKYIRGRINYDELTSYARDELEAVVSQLIEKNESRFINFFNVAGPLTTRLHSLELLPGVGKKHMWQIIGERKKKPFESFKELQTRIGMLPDPKRIVARRIVEELKGKDRHRVFVGSDVV